MESGNENNLSVMGISAKEEDDHLSVLTTLETVHNEDDSLPETIINEDNHLLILRRIANGDINTYRSELLKKVETNGNVELTDDDRLYIYHHFKLHENCFSAEDTESCSSNYAMLGTSSESKSKKLKVNETKMASDTIIHGSTSQGSASKKEKRPLDEIIKTYTAVRYDYDVIRNYLRSTYHLPPEKLDQKTYDECFKILFENRRAYIMSCNPSVKIVKEFHPYLFNKKEVFTEFQLLVQNENLYEEYVERVKRYSSSIIDFTDPCPTREKIKNKIKIAKKDDKEWMKKAGSLVLLPRYMGDDRRNVLIFKDEKLIQDDILPYIQCYGDISCCLKRNCRFRVIIEKVNLCEVSNILEAFFGLMAAYYIFNAQYPPSCIKTLVLFEKLYTDYPMNSSDLPRRAEERIEFLIKRSYKETK